MSEPRTGPSGVLLSDDMIFTSRITGTARDLGLSVKPAGSVAALEALAQQAPAAVIVDLSIPRLDIGDLLTRLRQKCPRMPRVIAYGAHIDTAALRAARAAGCDVVLPRSKFVEDLPHKLPQWLSAADQTEH